MEQVLENFVVGGCCCEGVDMEMKNAVAIQRNAAAIAALIRALQKIQDKVDELEAIIKDMSDESV